MAGFPNPITSEDLPKAWSTVCRKYKKAKVAAAIRKIAKPIGEFLFFPIFLILAYGAAVNFTTPNVSALISSVPVAPDLWQKLEATIFGSSDGIVDCVVRSALLLYAIPFAVFLVVALIIALAYHPKTYTLSGDRYQDGQALWTMARHALTDSRSKGKDVSGTMALITGIVHALGSLAVVFYWLLVPGGEDVLAGIGIANTLKLFALALILIFSYALVAFPLNLLMKLACATPVSPKIPESAEDYCRGLRRGPAAVSVAPVAATAVVSAAVPAETPAEAPAPSEDAPAETPAEPETAPAE